jgi:glycosyltransferase involved in cell wall biosynthesis
MRICLFSWAPFIGGAEVSVERLAVGLAEAGHEIVLVVGTDGDAFERFRRAGIRCLHVAQRFTDKLHWLEYRQARKALLDILRREQPDLVHSNDLPTHQMVSDAARWLRIPRVCHHRWIFKGVAIDWLNKFGADQHLFVSRALMEMLSAESQTLAQSPRAVVYDGLPLPELPTADERLEARRKLQLPLDKPVVLFAGQIIERKGVADLLCGWSMLSDSWHGRAELVVVGDDLAGEGAYRREMEALAGDLKCPIRFLGFQKNVPEWLTAADIVIVPSHAEPLGNTTLEAMAYGLPVIGSNVGGIPEMIVDERTGLLISPKSPCDLAVALDRLLSTPPLRQRMGIAARRRCEEMFSLEAHVKAVLQQYEVVLTRPNSLSSVSSRLSSRLFPMWIRGKISKLCRKCVWQKTLRFSYHRRR